MPFSRSRSPESMTRSTTAWFERKAPVWRSIASTSVVLPWSTWATMATIAEVASRRARVAAVSDGRVGGGHGAGGLLRIGSGAFSHGTAPRPNGRAPRLPHDRRRRDPRRLARGRARRRRWAAARPAHRRRSPGPAGRCRSSSCRSTRTEPSRRRWPARPSRSPSRPRPRPARPARWSAAPTSPGPRSHDTDAVLLWPARMTWVGPETITSLIEAHGTAPDGTPATDLGRRAGLARVVLPVAALEACAGSARTGCRPTCSTTCGRGRFADRHRRPRRSGRRVRRVDAARGSAALHRPGRAGRRPRPRVGRRSGRAGRRRPARRSGARARTPGRDRRVAGRLSRARARVGSRAGGPRRLNEARRSGPRRRPPGRVRSSAAEPHRSPMPGWRRAAELFRGCTKPVRGIG